MAEKKFMVIEIVDGGVKPYTFTEDELKGRHAKYLPDDLLSFLKDSEPGDFMESEKAFIFNINSVVANRS